MPLRVAGREVREPPPPVPGRRFPDFLGIGAHKAGTSWLDRNLRSHPLIWLPPVKEIHYFDELYLPGVRDWAGQHRLRGARRLTEKRAGKSARPQVDDAVDAFLDTPGTDDWYGRIFSHARPESLCGEITPAYGILPEAGIRHAAALSPHLKAILSLRDPLERSWSQIRMEAGKDGMGDLARIEEMAGRKSIVDRSNYPRIIANWRKFIPEERFLIVWMEDIRERPLALLESVCGFLGLETKGARFAKSRVPVHVGQGSAIPGSVRDILRRRLEPIYRELGSLFPGRTAAWIARHY